MRRALLLLLSATTGTLAQPVDDSVVRSAVFPILARHLVSKDLGSSADVIRELEEKTGLSDAQVRGQLLALLDGLDADRKKLGRAWKDMLPKAPPNFDGMHPEEKVAAMDRWRRDADEQPRETEKAIENLSKRLRQGFQMQKSYSLARLLDQAVAKSRLEPYQLQQVLLRLCILESRKAVQLPGAIRLALAVPGHASSIHKSVLSVLVPELNASAHLDTLSLVPEGDTADGLHCRLTVRLDSDHGRGAGGRGEYTMNTTVLLEHIDTGILLDAYRGTHKVYGEVTAVSSDRGTMDISSLYPEVAGQIRDRLEACVTQMGEQQPGP